MLALGVTERSAREYVQEYRESGSSLAVIDRRHFNRGQQVEYRLAEHKAGLIRQVTLNLLQGESNSERGLVEQLEQLGFMSQEGFSPTFRRRTLSVVAICLNVIPLNLYNRYQMTESMRGIVFPTAIYVIAWIIYFGPYIF